MSQPLVISAANLDVLENNLGYLANSLQGMVGNINSVTGQVNAVETKINSVESEVKTLADEIREFMLETRNTTIVNGAKQNIMLLENEIAKKYSHRDEVRRSMLGILESTDLNFIKNKTIENMAEELMIKSPNYFLAPALIALSAWTNNNKELANKALLNAINKDDEQTSLLFSFIHRRANKNQTSLMWLNRYLSMQDPSNMEKKFITVMDSITSGVFGNDIKAVFLEKINIWIKELDSRNTYYENTKKRWKEFIISNLTEFNDNMFPYLVKFSPNYEELKNMGSFSELHNQLNIYFNNIINSEDSLNNNYIAQVDEIIRNLIFNYQSDELTNRKELAKNEYIIKEEGNVKKALESLEVDSTNFETTTDFYTLITNIVINSDITKPFNSTKKFALALLKNIILDAYNEIIEEKGYKEIDITIKISDWEGITKDGSNEVELKKSFNAKLDKDTYKEVYSQKLFNYKMLIVIVVALIISYFTRNIIYISIIPIALALIYCGYEFYKAYKVRKINVNSVNTVKTSFSSVMGNIVAEIVDYKKIINKNNQVYNDVTNLINNLNIMTFINKNTNDTSRTIIMEDNNEQSSK